MFFFSQCMTSTSNVQDISMDVTSTGDSCPKNRRRSSGSMSVTSSVSSTRVSYKKEEPAHMCQVITSHWRIQGRRPPPHHGTLFFRFWIHFWLKAPVLDVGVPPPHPQRGGRLPKGNPGSAPVSRRHLHVPSSTACYIFQA